MLRMLVAALAYSLLSIPSYADQPLVIHEWGTFTCLQDEAGAAIGGINADTELLPAFVHNFASGILVNASEKGSKGLGSPAPRMDITMRLETPVLYFHLPSKIDSMTLDIDVLFRGGWLTQFYPDASAEIDGKPIVKQPQAALHARTTGNLAWKKLTVGTDAIGPTTSARVWTAPRDVKASSVTTAGGEHERFLFYRGVGQIPAPLRVLRDPAGSQLELHSQLDSKIKDWSPMPIRKLWLVHVRPDQSIAMRDLDAVTLTPKSSEVLARTAANFSDQDFDVKNLARLQAGIKDALIEEGLFNDEAQALLNTWEYSYFKTPGLRLFFMVPVQWTDAYLPLNVSLSATIRRSMIGRIELVTPGDRRLLQEIATVPISLPDKDFLGRCAKSYVKLGRFRNALLLDEEKRAPTPSLTAYIGQAQLKPYQPTTDDHLSLRP